MPATIHPRALSAALPFLRSGAALCAMIALGAVALTTPLISMTGGL